MGPGDVGRALWETFVSIAEPEDTAGFAWMAGSRGRLYPLKIEEVAVQHGLVYGRPWAGVDGSTPWCLVPAPKGCQTAVL